MKTTVTLDWQRATTQQKEAWCQFVPLNTQFIKDNWKHLLIRQKMKCIVYQKLDEDFILQKWYELSEQGQIYCLRRRPFSIKFSEELWLKVKPALKTTIVLYQNLAPEFIQQRWQDIGVHEKRTLLQKYTFDVDFIEDVLQTERILLNSILSTQPLTESRLLEHWTEPNALHMIIDNENIPIEFIIDHWKDTSEDLHIAALEHRAFPESFITQYWPIFSDDETYTCLHRQKVPIHLIERDWNTLLTYEHQCTSIMHQKLSQELIEAIWADDIILNLITFQQFSKNFLLEKWKDLDSYEKDSAVKNQNCLKELTLEELPRFLSDNNRKVRQWATRQFKRSKEGV